MAFVLLNLPDSLSVLEVEVLQVNDHENGRPDHDCHGCENFVELRRDLSLPELNVLNESLQVFSDRSCVVIDLS